jgi:general secretion pathway protein G
LHRVIGDIGISNMRRLRKTAPGFTLIELIVATAIIMVLASAALPLARVQMRRYRELELKKTLREMRTAIDRFKNDADGQRISPTELRLGNEGYPASLQQLVDGVARANDASGTKLKYLRRIPLDPVTGQADWGMRSYQDPPDGTVWGGQNVFDVYSKAQGVGLDGTKYKDW